MKITKILLVFTASVLLAGCFGKEKAFPKELGLSEPVYQVEVSHILGPAGINKSFKVYQLKTSVYEDIEQSGLIFLNQMQSSLPFFFYDEFEPYKHWKKLPIENDKQWSYGPKNHDLPTLLHVDEFWGQYYWKDDADKFSAKLSPERYEQFQHAIVSDGGFYAYGGYRGRTLLILLPNTREVIFAHRG